MARYISAETNEPVVIACTYAERPDMNCADDTTATALRGQWRGGDPDVDPVWVPVCLAHDLHWDIDDTGQITPPQHRLPRFGLATERPVTVTLTYQVVVDVPEGHTPEQAGETYMAENGLPDPIVEEHQ